MLYTVYCVNTNFYSHLIIYQYSLVLHSPLEHLEDTMRVWKVFETLVKNGNVLRIGLSNCYDLSTLQYIYENADIKPSFIQNRFYSESQFGM
jgi:diketogulonate reductase-like aldo/keto reductase